MKWRAAAFSCAFFWSLNCYEKPLNIFRFCRDFDATGCITPQDVKTTYSTAKSTTHRSIRDFANSIYFRGDRVAFEIQNAQARWPVTFECLRGHYYFEDNALDRHELEYLELREKNVYGLVMLGSLIETKFKSLKSQPYRKLPDFSVTYAVSCGRDLLSKRQILIELK